MCFRLAAKVGINPVRLADTCTVSEIYYWAKEVESEDRSRWVILCNVIRNSVASAFGTMKDMDFKRFLSQFEDKDKVTKPSDLNKMRKIGILEDKKW